MGALEKLHAEFDCQMLFVESGGDNLAANYSRELADYIIYVVSAGGGAKGCSAPAKHGVIARTADRRLGRRQDPSKGWPRDLSIRSSHYQQGEACAHHHG